MIINIIHVIFYIVLYFILYFIILNIIFIFILQHTISIGIEFFSYIKSFLCLTRYVMIIKKGKWVLNYVEI